MKSSILAFITVAPFATTTASAQWGAGAGLANYGSYGGYGYGNVYNFGFDTNSCNFADSLWTDYCNGGPQLGGHGCGHGCGCGFGFGGCGQACCGQGGCGQGGCGHGGHLRALLSRRPVGGGHACRHRGRRSAGQCGEDAGCADACEADCGFAAVPDCGYQATPDCGYQAAPGCGYQAAPDCGYQAAPGCGLAAAPGCGGGCCGSACGGCNSWWYGYGTPVGCGRHGHGCHARGQAAVCCADDGCQSGGVGRHGCGHHQGGIGRLFGRGRHHMARNAWVGGGPLDCSGLIAAYEFPGSCVNCSFGGCGDYGSGNSYPTQSPADGTFDAPSSSQPEVSPENGDPAFDTEDSYSPLDDGPFSGTQEVEDVEPLPGTGPDDA